MEGVRASCPAPAGELLQRAHQALRRAPDEAQALVESLLSDQDPQVRAKAGLLAARAAWQLQEHATVKRRLDDVRPLCAELVDTLDEVEFRLLEGRMGLHAADYRAAMASFASAAQLAQMLGDQTLELTALNLQARSAHAMGQPQSALGILTRGLRRLSDDAPPEQVARIRSNIGQIHRELGNLSEALAQLLAAQEVFEANPAASRPAAVNLINMGLLYQDLGQMREAGQFLQRAHQVGMELGDGKLVAVALNNLANGDLATGDLFVARDRFKVALEQAEKLGMAEYIIDNLDGLGQTLADLGEYTQALHVHEHALAVARSEGSRSGELDALVNLGRDYLHLGEPALAVSQLSEALTVVIALQRRSRQLVVQELLSEAHEAAGDPWSALVHARECQQLQAEVSAEQNQERLRELQVKHQVTQVQQEADAYRLRSELMNQAIADAEARVRRRTKELEEAHLDVIERLALAAEYRDEGTAAHTRRVGRNAAVIAYVLGFTEDEALELYLAAKLHDVGKIAVPDAVLYKPGQLDETERRLVEQHTLIGARLFSGSQSRLLQLAEQVCLCHHERFDGQGYPQRLAGEAIPLAARIVTAADVLDALTHTRPYKPAWSVGEALQEIKVGSGEVFDPQIAHVCVDVFGAQGALSPVENVASAADVERAFTRLRSIRRSTRGRLFG